MKRRFLTVIFVTIVLTIICCRSEPIKPVKIAHLSQLGAPAVGTQVEFTAWVGAVAGDTDLNWELNVGEGLNSYPRALVELKDGQPNPGKDREICIRGQLKSREEINGGLLYRIDHAEVISCY